MLIHELQSHCTVQVFSISIFSAKIIYFESRHGAVAEINHET